MSKAGEVDRQKEDFYKKFMQTHQVFIRSQNLRGGEWKVEINRPANDINALLWLIAYQFSLLGQDNVKLQTIVPGLNTTNQFLVPNARHFWPDSEQEEMLNTYLEEVKEIVEEAKEDVFADMPILGDEDRSSGDGDSDMPSNDAPTGDADFSESSSGNESSGDGGGAEANYDDGDLEEWLRNEVGPGGLYNLIMCMDGYPGWKLAYMDGAETWLFANDVWTRVDVVLLGQKVVQLSSQSGGDYLVDDEGTRSLVYAETPGLDPDTIDKLGFYLAAPERLHNDVGYPFFDGKNFFGNDEVGKLELCLQTRSNS